MLLPLTLLPLMLGCAWVDTLDPRLDYDGDGFTDVAFGGRDCADNDASIHPDAQEVCGNDVDEDCDGALEVEATWYVDNDGDGWGVAGVESCGAPAENYVQTGGDCDDDDASWTPETIWYSDGDSDGFGGSVSGTGCDGGTVQVGGDCDDDRPDVYPGAPDGCTGRDNDCDGEEDEDGEPRWPDGDGDGFGDDSVPFSYTCTGVTKPYDCDDGDADVRPTAVACKDRCSEVTDACAAHPGDDLFMVAGDFLGWAEEGVVVGFSDGDGLVGWFPDTQAGQALTVDDARFVFDPAHLSAGVGERDYTVVDVVGGDGLLDLVVTVGYNNNLLIPGPLEGTFVFGSAGALRLKQGYTLQTRFDANGDGASDVGVSDHEGTLMLYLGGGTSFQAPDFTITSPDHDDRMSLGVFDHDGGLAFDDTTDLTVAPGSGAVYLLDPVTEDHILNDGDWRAKLLPPEDMPIVKLVGSGDVDGDGEDDLLIELTSSSPWVQETVVVWGPIVEDGDIEGSRLRYGQNIGGLGDLDGDGAMDLGFSTSTSTGVLTGQRFDEAVLLGNGWVGLESSRSFRPVGDVDGNGAVDLGVDSGGGVQVWLY